MKIQYVNFFETGPVQICADLLEKKSNEHGR
jgi:hypothetical protein